MIKMNLFNKLRTVTGQRLVGNLSSRTLTDPFVSLLPKGLKFVPTPNPVTWQTFEIILSFSLYYVNKILLS